MKATESIYKLLDWAESIVPKKLFSSTPIFLMATAGLRSIPSEKADKILGVCRKTLEKSKFLFSHNWVRCISGVDEGIFG